MTKALGVSERDPKIWMPELDPQEVRKLWPMWLTFPNAQNMAINSQVWSPYYGRISQGALIFLDLEIALST